MDGKLQRLGNDDLLCETQANVSSLNLQFHKM